MFDKTLFSVHIGALLDETSTHISRLRKGSALLGKEELPIFWWSEQKADPPPMRGNPFLPVAFELTGTLVSCPGLWTRTETVAFPESGACSPSDKNLTTSSSGTEFLTQTQLHFLVHHCRLLTVVFCGLSSSVSSDKTPRLQATWSQVEICTPPGLDCASPYPKQVLESSLVCTHTCLAGSCMNILTLSHVCN